jgi:hypothetical protein
MLWSRLRVCVACLFTAASLLAACGGGGTTGTSTSGSSSSSSSSGASPDPCTTAATCDDCAAVEGCGFCYQTGRCQPGGAGGPSEGTCATWRPFDGFDAHCFGPVGCDPRPPAAGGAPCAGGEGCYIVSSTEGTRCLPAGTNAAGASCKIGAFSDFCVPGFACDLSGSTGACHQVCTVGEDGTCPSGSHCELLLDIQHGPYGVCR